MSLDEYKLSCELVGHSLDVRTVAVCDEFIVSGSRDKTAKIWEYSNGSYHERATLTNHKNYVSSVCILKGGEWICTGSNDSTICVYRIPSNEPVTVLRAHSSTVSALSAGNDALSFLSGSWDKTARIWILNGDGESSSIALEGHEAAVWAVVALKSGKFVTGSADKSIIYWSCSGDRLKTLKGHKDCVRGLLALPNDGLISAGNDAVIKIWSEDGECVQELHGHTNYIYTIAFNKSLGEDVLVSGGEDSTIRMWNANGALGEAMTLPAQSVWSVACMKNGDIVTGTSDGIVRIFTRDATRIVDEETLRAYDVAKETREKEANKSLGGVKVNELPGPEALLQRGREDQTKMIRHPDGKVICYQWSNGKWNSLGDVVGAAGGTQESSGKTLFEGKEYDYVFTVDISDTMPALKLPYNRGEDPWLVAQKFIHKHDLPQAYLEQIANFVITNAANGAVPETVGSSSYQDPFTGGSRYVPGSNDGFRGVGGNVDPFTGGSSYSSQSTTDRPQVTFTSSSGLNSDPTNGNSTAKHFPFSEYTSIDTCDPIKVLDKLKSFNGSINESLRVADDELTQAIKLAVGDHSSSNASITALKRLLCWPKVNLFPVLDIVRLAVRDATVSSALVIPEVLNIIMENVENPPACQLMSIRALGNMLQHEFGRRLVTSCLANILDAVTGIKQGSANLQIAIATLFLNLSIAQMHAIDEEQCHQLAEAILNFCLWSTDNEAFYRSLRALGNLLITKNGADVSALIVSTEPVMGRIMTLNAGGNEKLNEIVRQIVEKIQN